MQYTRQEALAKLLKSYESYYNIILADEGQKPLAARCEFYEHSQKYVLSKKQSSGLLTAKSLSICLTFPI